MDQVQKPAPDPAPAVQPVAVIELGTASIRMVIAQIDPDGKTRVLESLHQAVSLAGDTFTRGTIETATAEECVKALRKFLQVLKEYGLSERDVIAIATSAVREAANRDAFLDRLYIATGINVRSIDGAEVNRYTYAAVHPLFERHGFLKEGGTLVVEVGGGNTEVLQFVFGHVARSHSYRLGSLRLSSALETADLSTDRMLQVIRDQIDRTMQQVVHTVDNAAEIRIVALGGDIRLACDRLLEGWGETDLAKLSVAALAKLANSVVQMSADEVVRDFHVSYPDAETLGTALQVYARLARILGLSSIYVCKATLRDGVLAELATHGAWEDDFRQQVINSALETGTKYDFDRAHAEQVTAICRQLFGALSQEHRLGRHHELLLIVAAILHEAGSFVSNQSHHKHSMYLILNSDIFGLGSADLAVAALVARYHRRAMPKPSHEVYATLTREQRIAVTKMAAILRVADAIARGTTQPRNLDIKIESGTLTIQLEGAGSLAVEQFALRQKGDLFERTYGMKIVLRSVRRRSRGKA